MKFAFGSLEAAVPVEDGVSGSDWLSIACRTFKTKGRPRTWCANGASDAAFGDSNGPSNRGSAVLIMGG